MNLRLLEGGDVEVVAAVTAAAVGAVAAVEADAVEHDGADCGRGDGCRSDDGARGDDGAAARACAAASAAARLHEPFAEQAAAPVIAQVQPRLLQLQLDPHGVEAEVLAVRMGLVFENELTASCVFYPKMVEERHSGK